MFVRSARNHLTWMCLFAAVALLPPWSARGDESVLETSALRFLPADGAFYFSLQQNRRQYEAFINSNAFKRLKEVGFVQQALGELERGPLAGLERAKQDPMMGPLVDLVFDGLSQEIFVFGGEGYAEVAGALQELNMAANTAQLQALFTGGNPQRAQLEALLKFVQNLPEGASVPPTIIGFRLSNTDTAKGMLGQLEQMAKGMAQSSPLFQGRVSRSKIGGGDYVHVKLDGSMIPWDELRQEFPGSDGDFEKVKSKLEKKTLAVAVGIYDNYLLLSFGATTDHLAKLGTGASLASRPEFAKVKPVESEPITALSFINGDYLKKVANPQRQAEQLAAFIRSALANAPIGDELKKELQTDLDQLVAKFEQSLPQPGSVLSYCYLDGSGYTSATYNWGSMRLDASKPLGVLRHVGGNPLGFVAARPKYDASDYETLAKIVERLIYYGDRIADAYLDGKEKDLYVDLRDAIVPLLERLDKANRNYLIPAFKGVDGAVVLDGKTSSRTWTAFMPPAEEKLPMLELGIVESVNSSEQVKKGCAEYFAVLQEMLDQLHDISGKYPELFPTPVPKIQIPQPETREIAGGTVYYYSLPPQATLDPQIAPNAGLNDNVGVVSLIPKFTARLMETKSLSGDVAEFANQKAGAAYYFNFAGFIDTLLPWADYAAMFLGQINVAADQAQPAGPIAQIKEVAEFLKCLKSFRGITTQEGDVWVTRGKVTIQDR